MDKTIFFDKIDDKLITNLKNTLIRFLKEENISNKSHIFIAGLGNRHITSDSIGPRTIEYINANLFLHELGLKVAPKISLLEPGSLEKTGIPTKRILESIIDEIKPDIMIIIDSMLTTDKVKLNHLIKISNKGITPGAISCINDEISKYSMGLPIISILVPTAIKEKEFLLSTSTIDKFIDNISKTIGKTLNEVLYLFD